MYTQEEVGAAVRDAYVLGALGGAAIMLLMMFVFVAVM